jgi:UDPglucose 6-dehydrogenase
VMVCVATPIGSDGRSDLSQLRAALAGLDATMGPETPLVVRSTLPPGTTKRVAEWAGVPTSRVLTNPEFLRQGTALEDFLNPARVVVGHFPDAPKSAIDLVVGLFGRTGAPCLLVDVAAAELIKNGANAFLALKLSFANELAAMAERYGTDVEAVIGGIARDPRIGPDFMRPSFGFGGSCLPKELRALAAAGSDVGLEMHVTRAASDANRASQVRFLDTIEAAAGGLSGRSIGMLGLAFKAHTDDIRDSPAVWLARRLMGRGAQVRAHDPAAAANAKAALPGLVVVDDPAETLVGADVGVIATEWPQYRDIAWDRIRDAMGSPILVDGRRLLDAAAIRGLGYRLHVLGAGRAAPID